MELCWVTATPHTKSKGEMTCQQITIQSNATRKKPLSKDERTQRLLSVSLAAKPLERGLEHWTIGEGVLTSQANARALTVARFETDEREFYSAGWIEGSSIELPSLLYEAISFKKYETAAADLTKTVND